ncbi:MAG: toprim domain-containing protein [Desulfovibrio sp.]|jgi:recombination protein RecR|nr:toprim domain-containing protein [Desulfovibrio sp.]
MVQKLPESLSAVVEQLARLPGLGPKSALRAAMTFLRWPATETRRLGAAIFELREHLHLCGSCGAISDTDPCAICSDPARGRDVLCVTADWDSLLCIEDGGFYSGQYFILGGLLAPTGDRAAENMNLERLDARLAGGEIREVIMALGTTVEAENTEAFLCARLRREHPDMLLSRLAQGIPLCSEVKFMDRDTLRQSLKYRQALK